MMEDVIYNFIHDHLLIHVILIALAFAMVIIAMAFDLIFGVKKAKCRGEARTSTGLKKTAAKAQKYFSPMAVLCLIDILSSVIIPFPAFTMAWAIYCILCEFISIREKSWEKAELRKAEKTMSVIIENKDDIAKVLSQILFDKSKEDKNG